MPPTRVIVDTDPGLDDTAAILFALACPDLVTVEMLTTVFGNAGIDNSTRNALTILDAAGRTDIPVYQGAVRPLLREPRYAPHVHSDDGLGGLAAKYPPTGAVQPGIAAEKIVQHIMASPGEITLIALGPLTNVVLALRLEPRLAASVKEIVLMGGAVRVPGNVSPVASANMLNDPDAAAAVYSSGAALVQAGLDVALPTIISPAHLARIAASDTPAARLLTDVAKAAIDSYLPLYGDEGGARFNDLPTVAYVVDRTLFEVERHPVVIETTGTYTTAMTVVDWRRDLGRPENTDVLLGVDVPRLVELFTERVGRGQRAVVRNCLLPSAYCPLRQAVAGAGDGDAVATAVLGLVEGGVGLGDDGFEIADSGALVRRDPDAQRDDAVRLVVRVGQAGRGDGSAQALAGQRRRVQRLLRQDDQ